jgi:hypothetical protein
VPITGLQQYLTSRWHPGDDETEAELLNRLWHAGWEFIHAVFNPHSGDMHFYFKKRDIFKHNKER